MCVTSFDNNDKVSTARGIYPELTSKELPDTRPGFHIVVNYMLKTLFLVKIGKALLMYN